VFRIRWSRLRFTRTGETYNCLDLISLSFLDDYLVTFGTLLQTTNATPDRRMPNIVRFGPFELNLETADLKGIGPGTRLPEQQFQILRMLLQCEGGVVSRDEIRKRLWPSDTVVEFDGSINAAILKLRTALRCESNDDGFIETVARRGYRLLVPVQNGKQSSQRAIPESSGQESIAGENLQDLISKFSGPAGTANRRLPLSQLLDLAMQLVEGLGAVHLDGIVHRNVRPANVFVTPSGKVKFLAPETTADADYMSPEQLRGEPFDQRSDLFSLGIVLAELLNGFHPFRQTASEDAGEAILKDAPNLSGDLPEGLKMLIRRLLAKSIELRYPSIAAVQADLERLSFDLSAPHVTSAAAEIPLIGRDQEFAELKRLLKEALAGRGSIVMIGGEPGIGKTHLARDILEEGKHRGALGLIGHCYEMEGAPPYVPFVEMLEYIARMAPREGFRHTLGEDAPEVARLMPELRTIYPDIPPVTQLPPEQQRRFLFNAIRSYVERASRITPVVVVFEDLHWADEPTLLLLQHIAQAIFTTPILFVCTYRDVGLEATRPFAGALETLVRHKLATRLPLRRLPLGGVKGMLAALGGQAPPAPLVHAIFEETDGNPFFVEEVFRYLAEEGKLFDESGKWLPGLRVEDFQVPASVRLVLGRRLHRLSEGSQRVLSMAAVIGRSFSLRLLDELENNQPDTVLDAIEEAERAHLVVPEPERRDTRYRFVHELVRQTLAESLSLPRRQRLHMRIADAIERVYSANPESQAPSLAHHLYQAGAMADRERTTGYLLMATRQARTGSAHEEALGHLDHAISLWEGETSLRVAELMIDRANTLRNMGRTDEAVTSYRNAIDLLEATGAIARMVEASIALSYLLAWRFDFDSANEAMEWAHKQIAGQDPQLQSSVLSMRAAIMSISGEPVVADRMFDEVRALHRSMKTPPQGPSLLFEAIHYYQSFQINKVAATTSRLASACRAAGDSWNASLIEYYGPWADLYGGRPREGACALPTAILRAERIGNFGAVWALKMGASIASAARGDLVAAENETREAWEFGVAHEVGWNFAAGLQAGHISLWRGNLAEAEGWYSRGLESEGKSYLSGLSEACLFAAFAENRDPRAEQAWATRRWKSPLLGQLNSLGSWVALERSVIGLAHMGRRAELGALQPVTEELLLTGAWTYSLLSMFRTVAGIATAAVGNWCSAEEHHRTAIHQTDTSPYHHLRPVAREWYAKMLIDRNGPGDVTDARSLLEEAIAMYNSSAFPLRGRHSIELLTKL
jgi:DNA-binding winged helix-turn-helix (wHTH) protein/tetratricopeptide (TPR) repeat protein